MPPKVDNTILWPISPASWRCTKLVLVGICSDVDPLWYTLKSYPIPFVTDHTIVLIHLTGTLEKNGGVVLVGVTEDRFSSKLSLMARMSVVVKLALKDSKAETWRQLEENGKNSSSLSSNIVHRTVVHEHGSLYCLNFTPLPPHPDISMNIKFMLWLIEYLVYTKRAKCGAICNFFSHFFTGNFFPRFRLNLEDLNEEINSSSDLIY